MPHPEWRNDVWVFAWRQKVHTGVEHRAGRHGGVVHDRADTRLKDRIRIAHDARDPDAEYARIVLIAVIKMVRPHLRVKRIERDLDYAVAENPHVGLKRYARVIADFQAEVLEILAVHEAPIFQ